MAPAPDPYAVLGVPSTVSDGEVRAAYRHLVQLHHPDHNGGSAESAQRFEEVQEAYAAVRRLRQTGSPPGRTGGGPRRDAADPGAAPDPSVEARLAEMERELHAAREAREHAVRQAREAREQALRAARCEARPRVPGGPGGPGRASDEELGYISTDDSFSKILDDAAAELTGRFSEARHSPAGRRVSDLIDELSARLTGERRDPS